MSLPAFCKIEGEDQGLITGGNQSEESVGGGWQEDHVDEFVVQSYSQEVTVPREPHSGVSSRVARHNGPVHVTKGIDKCAPLLHQALAHNELLTTVTFTFFRVNATGVLELFYTVTLEDAVIASLRTRLLDDVASGSARAPMVQDVSFIYRSITWEHNLASTLYADEWHDPALSG
jgi:type VI secretion system secreted protein Hcp